MEENAQNRTTADEMISSVKEYVALKIDELKLKGVEGLSLLCSKIIYIFLAALIIVIALLLLGLSLAFFLGEQFGSDILGFLAVGMLFVIIFAILYLFRDRLFINRLVRFFIQLLFNENNNKR